MKTCPLPVASARYAVRRFLVVCTHDGVAPGDWNHCVLGSGYQPFPMGYSLFCDGVPPNSFLRCFGGNASVVGSGTLMVCYYEGTINPSQDCSHFARFAIRYSGSWIWNIERAAHVAVRPSVDGTHGYRFGRAGWRPFPQGWSGSFGT